jgi:hypothetical protein
LQANTLTDANTTSRECPRDDIAAYLDGELAGSALERFEKHVASCEECSSELLQQRRLLCALDFALGGEDPNISLPKNFAQVVATHAESDMSGLRNRAERRRAFRLCVGLTLASLILLGTGTLFSQILLPLKSISRYAFSVLSLAGNALYDTGVGIALILRALGRRFIFEFHPLSLLVLLFCGVALAVLPRLIVNYHRRVISE